LILVSLAAACMMTAGWAAIILAGGNGSTLRTAMKQKHNKASLENSLIILPFKDRMEQWRLYEQLSLPLGILHTKQIILNGAKWSFDDTKSLTAKFAGLGYLACLCCFWLSFIASEPVLLAIGIVIGIVLTIRPYMEAGSKVTKRRNQIILALPDMLSRLQLLIGAGENLQHAFIKVALSSQQIKNGSASTSEALMKEWRIAAGALHNGQSFSTVLERFNRNCAVQEVSIFTTVLLLNYKRGGEQLTLALRELSYTLWEKRKSVARMKGEEASSKLVFPLVGILLIMIVLIAAPAVMMM